MSTLLCGVLLPPTGNFTTLCVTDGGLGGETLGMEQGVSAAAHQTTLELAAAPLTGDLQVA
jgi:hypothetical protein